MRVRAVLAILAVASVSCAEGGGSRPRDVTVRVDFQNDEFASFYWRYFPRSVQARPGDTVVFKQEWTGEPHTVTFGTLVDEALARVDALEQRFADLDMDSPPEALAEAERALDEATGEIPLINPYENPIAQNAEQPCYLSEGKPPTDPDTPCPKDAQRQPTFDGTHAYYSSGYIPPEGPSGNEFRMELAEDTDPGTYRYYCVIHFPWMQGALDVLPAGAELPSPAEVNRQAREEIEELSEPLRQAFEEAKAGNAVAYRGVPLGLPLGGYHAADEFTVAINEFLPRTVETRTGRPVTWYLVGAHTISFDVPPYLPILIVDPGGTVRRNSEVDRPAGGAPRPPPVTFDAGPYKLDGGTWDGSGFFSSGLFASEPYATYTLRISEPGRYRYACLVHPRMVGTVIVRP